METREERASVGEEEGGENLSIPKGGPIYVSNLVGPLSSVPDFQSSVLLELQNLGAELLSSDSSQPSDEDISVDELKVFTEQELVEMAFKEVYENDQKSFQRSEEQPSEAQPLEEQPPEEQPPMERRSLRIRTKLDNFGGKDQNSSQPPEEQPPKKPCLPLKRKKLDRNSYAATVEKYVKIKEKQHEDKAAAILHSFNGGCKINKCIVPFSDRTERMKSLRFTSSGTTVKSSSTGEHMAVLYPEVVLSVEVYHNNRKFLKTQEFLVLGRQSLTELRDKINCLTDELMQKAGEHDPSGYFLIEDVFCNDLRDPSAIDYSKPVFDWLRNSRDDALKKWEYIITGKLKQKQRAIVGNITGLQLPQFKAVDMHKTRFCDLKFQVGAAYLYCHQGNCKHAIVIRDMRLIHPEDVHNQAAYPIAIFQLKPRVRKCSACNIFRATKVTVDDKWGLENPNYFCNDCYFLLHYGEDESLQYSDFSVFDYVHD